MLLAATFAGIGFGNAGTHLAHAMSYPVSGMVRDFVAEGYPPSHPADPARHVGGAQRAGRVPLHGGGRPGAPPLRGRPHGSRRSRGDDAGEVGDLLADALIALMRKAGLPNGLAAVGYGPGDVDQLVAGTLPQHTVTKLSPRPAGADDLRRLFLESMTLW